jgi:methyltransferase (TIGR00027 family)
MPQKGVEKKHSETALFAALHRTIAYKESSSERFGPDNLAEHFLPPHFRFFTRFRNLRLKTKSRIDKQLPGLYEYMIARTVFFDNAFKDALNQKIPQIVLLGAGYDTRAYRFANLNEATKIIELDIATTQGRKMNCLKKAQIDIPEHVKLVPIDFNKESLESVLEKAGYEQSKETLFLWEGVIYYLESEAVDATFEFINQSSHRESVIVFDYAVSIPEEDIDNYYGVRDFIRSMKKHHPGEIFEYSIDEANVESFLEERGLKLVKHMNDSEIENAFLLDEDGSLIGQLTGLFRFAMASPNRG